MQARLKEINQNIEYFRLYKDHEASRKYADQILIPQLLAALQEAQFERAQENKRNRWLCTQVKQAEARERVLREALERILNLHRTPIERPTKDGQGMRWDGKSYTYDNEGDIAREALVQVNP